MKLQNILIVIILLGVLLYSCTEKCSTAPVINAGTDTIVYNATSLTLNAKTEAESGLWKLIMGSDGVLSDVNSKQTVFSGSLNNSYTLVWESTNDCGTSTDTLKVEFQSHRSVDQMIDQIVWTFQSGFRINGTCATIYFDPVTIKENSKPADVILISHPHGDHFSPADIKKIANENTVVIGPADCKYSGICKEYISILPGETKNLSKNISVRAVPAYNIVKSTWHPKKSNWVGFVVTIDGVSIYHAGDTERVPEMKDFDCDIALLPLGQTYTMTSVADAAESAKDVKAEVAIPMHYGYAEGKASDAELFKTLLEGQVKVVVKTKE
jgi:L-ascorbate metabolism protein UlaG (beta-lactamase superfamily)